MSLLIACSVKLPAKTPHHSWVSASMVLQHESCISLQNSAASAGFSWWGRRVYARTALSAPLNPTGWLTLASARP